MDFYTENGFVDFPAIWEQGYTFNIIIGGRGTGKTYGALKFCYANDIRIMFSRRTEKQVQIIAKEHYSPYKKLNSDLGIEVHPFSCGNDMYAFYKCENVDDKFKPIGAPIAYCAALSTVANIRGLDGSDIDAIVLDEFIKKNSELPLKNEGENFADLYETIARNREILGCDPLRVFLLGNSNTLDSGILDFFDLITVIEKMKRRGRSVWHDDDKSILILLLDDSPISERKRETALYRAAKKYHSMALDNEFSVLDNSMINQKSLCGYRPLFSVSGVCVYQHKGTRRLYVTAHRSGDFEILNAKQAQKDYYFLYNYYIRGKIDFDTFAAKKALTNAMNWAII